MFDDDGDSLYDGYSLSAPPLIGFSMRVRVVPSLARDVATNKFRYSGKRYTELERTIARSPEESYWYAKNALHDRFPEAEPTLLKNTLYASWYAINVLRERWPELESIMEREMAATGYYDEEFRYAGHMKFKWPALEQAILRTGDIKDIISYARDISKTRWPSDVEEMILQKGTSKPLYTYARFVIKNRWPEAEEKIKKYPTVWARYVKFIEGKKGK